MCPGVSLLGKTRPSARRRLTQRRERNQPRATGSVLQLSRPDVTTPGIMMMGCVASRPSSLARLSPIVKSRDSKMAFLAAAVSAAPFPPSLAVLALMSRTHRHSLSSIVRLPRKLFMSFCSIGHKSVSSPPSSSGCVALHTAPIPRANALVSARRRLGMGRCKAGGCAGQMGTSQQTCAIARPRPSIIALLRAQATARLQSGHCEGGDLQREHDTAASEPLLPPLLLAAAAALVARMFGLV